MLRKWEACSWRSMRLPRMLRKYANAARATARGRCKQALHMGRRDSEINPNEEPTSGIDKDRGSKVGGREISSSIRIGRSLHKAAENLDISARHSLQSAGGKFAEFDGADSSS